MQKISQLALSVLFLYDLSAFSCTAFELPNSSVPVMAKTFDWYDDFGLVLVNKRNVEKKALTKTGTPVQWVSKNGSITFNQAGREFPFSGINEQGLAVELLALLSPGSSYPLASDPKPAINEFQWVQFILDGASNLQEAIQLAQSVRIDQIFNEFPLHYIVCEATGKCAVFDHLNGNLVVTTGAKLPVQLITNYLYSESVAKLSKPISMAPQADTRFERAAQLLSQFKPVQDPISYSFAVLRSIGQGDFSKWNIVFRLDTKRIYFRSLRANTIKTFSLTDFDFSCATPVEMLDINSKASGEVASQFQSYDPAVDAQFIRQARVWAPAPAMAKAAEALPQQQTRCR